MNKWSKRKIVTVTGIAIGVLSVAGLLTWTLGDSDPPPQAEPVVLSSNLETSLLSPNSLVVQLKNNGKSGWVKLDYQTSGTTTDIKREPDAVKWLKNTFTSEGSSGYKVTESTHTVGE
jgi:hypothetical protein